MHKINKINQAQQNEKSLELAEGIIYESNCRDDAESCPLIQHFLKTRRSLGVIDYYSAEKVCLIILNSLHAF